ncbi:MAG: hypothetical protein Q7U04_10605 [Bacteriovorax sp.]|nr:hypothetical protein [Bacteriovorax sp.]
MNKNLYDLRIKEFQTQDYNFIKIVLSDDSQYTADLSSDFSKLFCYPRDLNEWKSCHINEGAFAIEWATGFDIHFDQIIAIAENQKLTA